MADKKISELVSADALSGAELIETVQGGVNKKTTAQDIANLAPGAGHVIEDEGTPLTARTKLNFVGAGVTVTDDSGDDATVVTIDSTGAVASVTGDGVDNTDPANPVISYPEPSDIGAVASVNSATALTDGAAITLTATKHTLTSTQSAITFTVTYAGDDIVIELTLNATSSTWTFPAGSLCVSEGVASGDNTLGLSGVSGDKYIITSKKFGSVYYVVGKNFGQ